MEEKKLTYRMYFFVPYNISPIQQAIQAGHAALEYAWKFPMTQEYMDFMTNDKTWIILNGGTTNDQFTNEGFAGTLNQLASSLVDNEILFTTFREPDLNNALTAVCFLADERVWDYETYLEFFTWLTEVKMTPEASLKMVRNNPQLRRFTLEQFNGFFPEYYNEWVETILGGKKNEFLRNLIKGKKLA